MTAFPVHTIVVTLPLEIAEALAAQAEADGLSTEDYAAALLEEAVHLGTPGELRAVAQLATEAADLLANRWQQRRSELTQLRVDLLRIASVLARLTSGA
jgi:hypothetical protein